MVQRDEREARAVNKTFRWAAVAPLLCAIHCLAAPALVAIAPAVLVTARAEWGLMALTASLVIGMLGYGTRLHRRLGPWLAAGAGLSLWAGSLSGGLAPAPEPATTTMGSIVVAAALLWNSGLLHRVTCSACACPGCDPSGEAEGERTVLPRYGEGWTATR